MALTEAQSLELLRQEMDKQGMTDNDLRAGTAAIAMGESALVPKTEIGYSRTDNARIRRIFGSRVAGLYDAELDALKSNDQIFFDRVYGGSWGVRNLGNTEPGDGYRFRGRTVLQLTGRANYQKLKEMTGYDIVGNPDLANDPKVSAAIAVAYMRWRYNGGGWEEMKAAVGNNIPDIDAAKNEFYERFTSSGEMDVGTAINIDTGDIEAEEEITEWFEAVRKVQTFLRSKGFYLGRVDGDFGRNSRDALMAYLRNK